MKIKFSSIRTINFIKTIFFNFRFFDWKTAWHFPVLIGYGVKITTREKYPFILSDDFDLKGKKVTIGCVKNFSRQGVTQIDILIKKSYIVFSNGATICRKAKVLCHHGTLVMGYDSYLGENALVVCHKKIEIGKHVALAWNSTCYDSNFHFVLRKGERIVRDCVKPVKIGDHVWCGNSVTITPGAVIPSYSTVAHHSLVNKDFSHIKTQGNLFTGSPAVLKEVTPFFTFLWNHKLERKLHKYFDSQEHNGIFELPEWYPEAPYDPSFDPDQWEKDNDDHNASGEK